MLGWLWFLAPEPREPVGERPEPVDTIVVDSTDHGLAESELDQGTEAAPRDTSLAGAEEGEERLITVVSDLYQATFSTKGATLRSFSLKEYTKFDQATPVQMISQSERGAIGLAFTTPANHLVDTRDLYFDTPFEGDTLYVTGSAAGLSFSARLGSGTVRQSYLFEPEEYEVKLQVEQENADSYSTREGYELVWYGGIPLSEDDPEQEGTYSGAYGRSGGEVEKITLDGDEYQDMQLTGSVSWVAVKSKYFAAVMIPSAETRAAELVGERQTLQDGPVWEDYQTRLMMSPSSGEVHEYRLYVGPMEFYRITDYRLGLYGVVDYGYDFFEWMTRPLAQFIFIPFFTFLSTFITNYGLVIIVFSIAIKAVLYPLTKKSYESMARMRELQPKMEAVKEKFKDDPQKQQQAMMKVYKDTGVNPLGGCMPMLLQWPVIIALWQYLPQAIELRQQGFLWANDLSAPDAILHLPFTIPFYGDFVAGFTLLMGLSMIVQMRLQSAPSANPQAKVMMYVFPVVIFMFFNRLASGLSLYYLCYNVLTAAQQKIINRSIEKGADEKDPPNGRGGREDVKRVRARRIQRKKKQAVSGKAPRSVRRK